MELFSGSIMLSDSTITGNTALLGAAAHIGKTEGFVSYAEFKVGQG